MLVAFKSYDIISAPKRSYLLNSGSIDLHARIGKNQGSKGASDLVTFSSRNERHCSQSIVNSKGRSESGIRGSNDPKLCIFCSVNFVIGTLWNLLVFVGITLIWNVYDLTFVSTTVSVPIFQISQKARILNLFCFWKWVLGSTPSMPLLSILYDSFMNQ